MANAKIEKWTNKSFELLIFSWLFGMIYLVAITLGICTACGLYVMIYTVGTGNPEAGWFTATIPRLYDE